MPPNFDFPTDFVWGTATASYQVEGAAQLNGRGESIWDRFSHTPGNILNGDTGDVACDHYHLWPTDVALMRELGVSAYRFSIAWPRVFPSGKDALNQAGLDFYDRLVDGLLEAGITPYPTLYHWDLPMALEDETSEAGGWLSRSTAYAFADYAAVVAERLADRVRNWWTINEPWCVAELGYRHGIHAPGRRTDRAWLAAAHHVLLAHGLGAQAVRSVSSDAQVGIVINLDAHTSRSAHPADLEATQLAHDLRNRWYLDPVLLGSYPQSGVDHYDWDLSEVLDGDLAVISEPLDHLGINYYTREVVQDKNVDDTARPLPLVEADLPRTAMGWEIHPQGLCDLLLRLNNDYALPPVFITENGTAFDDELVEGEIDDQQRIEFLEAHFEAAHQALTEGVPLKGYFVWSLLDNFEWTYGYSRRFGLIWVDFDTLQRVPKASARWFTSVIAAA